MNVHLPRLIELQALDLRIVEVNLQRRQIPARREAAQQPLRAAIDAQKSAAAAVETLTKERRAFERELDAHEAHIEKMKGRTSEIKTNKEYQAHLFEIELAGKKKGDIEERILTVMEQVESLQRQVKDAQANVEEAERAYEHTKRELDALESSLTRELQELESRHQVAIVEVPRELVERYAKLKAQRKDLALAALRDGICQGCRLHLPPQLVAEVKRSDDLVVCDYCHRILYWEGDLPSEIHAASRAGQHHDDEAGESV